MTRRGWGHVKEKLRLFYAVALDTGSDEDALWAVLEADRKDRADEFKRARDGLPISQRDPFPRAVLAASAARARMTVEELRGPSKAHRVVEARAIAIRVLRGQGYSYRAIGRTVGFKTWSPVGLALGRVASRRDLVEAAERVRKSARRRIARRPAA